MEAVGVPVLFHVLNYIRLVQFSKRLQPLTKSNIYSRVDENI